MVFIFPFLRWAQATKQQQPISLEGNLNCVIQDWPTLFEPESKRRKTDAETDDNNTNAENNALSPSTVTLDKDRTSCSTACDDDDENESPHPELDVLFPIRLQGDHSLLKLSMLLQQVLAVADTDFGEKFLQIYSKLPEPIQDQRSFVRFARLCLLHAPPSTAGDDPEDVLSMLNSTTWPPSFTELPVFRDIEALVELLTKTYLCKPRLMRLAHLALAHMKLALKVDEQERWVDMPAAKLKSVGDYLAFHHCWLDCFSPRYIGDALDTIERCSWAVGGPPVLSTEDALWEKYRKCWSSGLFKREWLRGTVEQIAISLFDDCTSASRNMRFAEKNLPCAAVTYPPPPLKRQPRPRLHELVFTQRIVGFTSVNMAHEGEDESLWLKGCLFVLKLLQQLRRALRKSEARKKRYLEIAAHFPFPLNTLEGLKRLGARLSQQVVSEDEQYSARYYKPEWIYDMLKEYDKEISDTLWSISVIPRGLMCFVQERERLAREILLEPRLLRLAHLVLLRWKSYIGVSGEHKTWKELWSSSESARCIVRVLVPSGMTEGEFIAFLDDIEATDGIHITPRKPVNDAMYLKTAYESDFLKDEWVCSPREKIALLILRHMVHFNKENFWPWAAGLPDFMAPCYEVLTSIDLANKWSDGIGGVYMFFKYADIPESELESWMPPGLSVAAFRSGIDYLDANIPACYRQEASVEKGYRLMRRCIFNRERFAQDVLPLIAKKGDIYYRENHKEQKAEWRFMGRCDSKVWPIMRKTYIDW